MPAYVGKRFIYAKASVFALASFAGQVAGQARRFSVELCRTGQVMLKWRPDVSLFFCSVLSTQSLSNIEPESWNLGILNL
jgi:hypothetical protein